MCAWGGSNPLSSRMSAGGRVSDATRIYTGKAITNADAYTHKQTHTHTQRLTQRLGGIIPALPAHCGDLSLDRTCCLHGEQVSDQVSAVRWRLAASSQLTSHENLVRGHENFQLNEFSEAYVIKMDSIMSPVSPGSASVCQRLKSGALLLNSDNWKCLISC